MKDNLPFKKLDESGADEKTSAFSVGSKTNSVATGSSGTEIFGGYFSEEYLNTLRGPEAANVWDKMRRSESQVAMLLAAIINPIKSANWEIEPYKQEPEFIRHAELLRTILFEGIDFETFKHEALTKIAFGFSVFEIVHSVVFDHPEFGTFNGLQALGFRSQKTIQSWNLEKKTGRIISIDQWAQGDIGDRVQILGDFLIVFTNSKEGDNYEGISALRPMYGAYSRKNLYLKLTAIGVEKYAVGTPIGTVPANKENTKDFDKFKEILRSYTSHEQSFLTKSEGWTIEFQKNDFDAGKIVELLKFENTEMINAVVANFLALGTNGGGGAFALSNDLSDFFSSGIQTYADNIAGGINRKLIPDLCKLNFGQLAGYPKLKVTGISDKAGKELAEVVELLTRYGSIKSDVPFEEWLRRQYKMPKPDPKTSRDIPAAANANGPTPGGGNPNSGASLNAAQVKLAEGATENQFTKTLDSGKAEVKALMQARLKEMANALKKKLIKGGEVVKSEIPAELIASYKQALQGVLAKQAVISLREAQAESHKSKKLDERLLTMQLAAPAGAGYYNALPENIKKIVETQAALLADTQSADISKVVSFQFTSSSTGTENPDQIDQEIDESVDKVLAGDNTKGMSVDAAAGDAIAQVANQARTEYFFEPDVLDEIESFTFENNDPVSDICQELAGTTFDKNDPSVDEYTPPLHHNCKSRMVPNLKGTDAPSVNSDALEISDKAKKSITL